MSDRHMCHQVVGQTFQNLDAASPRTYIGSGKTVEIESIVDELEADTVIFDDELSPGQLRNLEKAWGDRIRLCDRTALILDIFSQRAATKEGQLQASLIKLASRRLVRQLLGCSAWLYQEQLGP